MKILLALDPFGNSVKAIEEAMIITKQREAELVMVAIAETFQDTELTDIGIEGGREALMPVVEKSLEKARNIAVQKGIKPKVIVIKGIAPDTGILKCAEEEKVDLIVLKHLNIPERKIKLDEWENFFNKVKNPSKTVDIAVCGKYIEMQDAYKSIIESFIHAGAENDARVKLHWINAEELETEKPETLLKGMHGILIPGGFGERGVEGKINAITFARKNNIPFFGICLGLQCAVIEYARNVCGITKAHSSEFHKTRFNVVDIMPDQKNIKNIGGTMRLGAYPCIIEKNTKAFQAYKSEYITERHRHRYEVNNKFRSVLQDEGLIFSGLSPDRELVEMIELPGHPWFVGCQFHPELKSRATKAHPLFRDFVKASLSYKTAKAKN